MRILGIDTATSIASAALIEDGRIIAEQIHGSPNRFQTTGLKANHAEVVLSLVEAVLRDAGVSLCELSGFAVSIGPGSFTGLRIGLSTVKGLAYGLDTPVVGVSTLHANAARVENFDGLICSLLDARKKEVYGALFRRNGDGLARTTEDRVGSVAEIVALAGKFAGSEPCLFAGDGSIKYQKLLMDAFGSRAILTSGERYPSMASAVARLSGKQIHGNGGHNLTALVPVYLRPAEAELKTTNQT
jgi:tRNA threonylcarbamoyladenosine biosynthesis protein TsaB